ncbi:putative actin-related protein arp1 [Paratrimastix pyriformis]|uniref:Actin-related protein arp1 n=1 Tax=Paratrimastix pyriformis TaxID=342808 RepID=A0ABQ8UKH8_9EUKA|nr:putative actin-related protein arp1 [Paratrimastix pyriformis]
MQLQPSNCITTTKATAHFTRWWTPLRGWVVIHTVSHRPLHVLVDSIAMALTQSSSAPSGHRSLQVLVDSIAGVLVDSIAGVDVDLRRGLYSQMVLAGGSTLFRGFGERLLRELRGIVPADVKIHISAPHERRFSTWIGGSILASLDSFKHIWVTQQQYKEEGPRILSRHMF